MLLKIVPGSARSEFQRGRCQNNQVAKFAYRALSYSQLK